MSEQPSALDPAWAPGFREAARRIQAIHPGETKNSVTFLLDLAAQAEQQAATPPDVRETAERDQYGAIRGDCCEHGVIWHHERRGCGYYGYGDSRCTCALTHDEALARALASMPRPEAAVIDADHLARQREWSERTFGPGTRLLGVLDHIRKELREIEADPADVTEWIDVVILALDGAWRAGWEPQQIIDAIKAKQARNESRTWPDWREASPDHAIEHVREDAPHPEGETRAATQIAEAERLLALAESTDWTSEHEPYRAPAIAAAQAYATLAVAEATLAAARAAAVSPVEQDGDDR